MGGFCEVHNYLLTPVLGLGHVVSFCWESQKLEQGIEEGVRPRQIVLMYDTLATVFWFTVCLEVIKVWAEDVLLRSLRS